MLINDVFNSMGDHAVLDLSPMQYTVNLTYICNFEAFSIA
jgi:hypothetical protein